MYPVAPVTSTDGRSRKLSVSVVSCQWGQSGSALSSQALASFIGVSLSGKKEAKKPRSQEFKKLKRYAGELSRFGRVLLIEDGKTRRFGYDAEAPLSSLTTGN
jgi:hypothetical protein